MEEKLFSFLKTGADWGRLKTSVPGIFILKMPAYKSGPPQARDRAEPRRQLRFADEEEGFKSSP